MLGWCHPSPFTSVPIRPRWLRALHRPRNHERVDSGETGTVRPSRVPHMTSKDQPNPTPATRARQLLPLTVRLCPDDTTDPLTHHDEQSGRGPVH